MKYGWDYADISDPCWIRSENNYLGQNPVQKMSMCALLNASLSDKHLAEDFTSASQYLLKDYKINGDTALVSKDSGQYTTYKIADGMVVGFRGIAMRLYGCHIEPNERYDFTKDAHFYCTGFIDVNGSEGPNEETLCSQGTTSANRSEYCVVNKGAVKDIYPVVFHDSIVEPASNAAAYVLRYSGI